MWRRNILEGGTYWQTMLLQSKFINQENIIVSQEERENRVQEIIPQCYFYFHDSLQVLWTLKTKR